MPSGVELPQNRLTLQGRGLMKDPGRWGAGSSLLASLAGADPFLGA
jgi:hypothetical protein